MEIQFDTRGNLMPYEKIELDFGEFCSFYFDGFPKSSTRSIICENYMRYIQDFKKEITEDFIQWIDGSFVSNKLNPKDIDFVTLIDYDIYEMKEVIIEDKFRKFGLQNNYDRIDAYAVKHYPLGHNKEKITKYDLIYWKNWFSETKNNKAKKRFPKGFIEVNFGNKKI